MDARETDGEIYFHLEHSFLSNFHPSSVTLDGVTFPRAEHRYQVMRCALTNDFDRCGRVQLAQTPLEAKRLADALPESADWRLKREDVMETYSPFLAK